AALYVSPDRLRPGLGAEDAVLERYVVWFDASTSELFSQRLRVGRRTGDHLRLQVHDQRDLPVRHAAGHGDDAHAKALAAAVQAQPAGEEAVTVRVVEQHAGCAAGGGKTARVDLGEQSQVVLRIADDRRLASGPGGRVHARQLLRTHREQPHRVVVVQVVLARYGEATYVIDRLDRAWIHAGVRQRLTVERHALGDVAHEAAEPLAL